MEFGLTSVTVLIMLLYAVPGYLLVKSKKISPNSIAAFSIVLLYVCQPCLTVYSFQKTLYNKNLFINMLIFLGLSALVQIIMLLGFYLILRKKYDDAKYRVITLAATFGNVGFMGVPLLEALMPQNPEAVAYSATFTISMNFLSWSLGSFLLTRDKKYIKAKELVINPPMLSLFVALPLFFTRTALPSSLLNGVTILGKMTTPLCMLILGMRFATVKKRDLFKDGSIYITSAIKLIVFPLLSYLLAVFLPIDNSLKATLFILCACPTASIVLNLAEIYNTGQKSAANIVLASTIFSIITIPLLLLIL